MEITQASNPLKYYRELRKEMIEADGGRDGFFRKINQIDRVDWSLPEAMAQMDGVHKVVSPDGRDAIRTATRTLSGTFPRIKWRPEANNEETKKQANVNERMLELMLLQASKRNEVPIQRDVVKQACKYDMVAAEVIDLMYQKSVSKAYGLGGDVRHWELALRQGRFIAKFRDVLNVHRTRSDFGLNGVLYETVAPLKRIIEHWGKDKFKNLLKEKTYSELMTPYTICDYTSLDDRVVWLENTKEPIEIMRCKNELPFMGTWIVRAGGTNVDEDSQYAYEPLLASVVLSGQWETQNVVETLGVTDEIWRAFKPAGIKKGVNADQIEQDFTKPGNDIVTESGQDYVPIPRTPSDQAKFALADRIQDRMQRSSVARILQDAQMPTNTAFSAINSVMGVASSMIRPHKILAELALGDILTRMVDWVCYTKEPLMLYGDNTETYKRMNDEGTEYNLDPQFIDEEHVFISVELEPELPMDKQQKINAASAAVTTLGYSKESALEDIGVNDPTAEMRKSTMEQIEMTMLEAWKTEFMGQAQAKVQAMIMQVQMQAQQAQAEQQQAMQPQGAPQTGDFNQQGANSGEMFNPGQGGLPAQMGNPGQTFEGQTGMTRSGENINA